MIYSLQKFILINIHTFKTFLGFQSVKSKRIDDNLNPVWVADEILRLSWNGSDSLIIKVFDHDNFKSDDSLGHCEVKLNEYINDVPITPIASGTSNDGATCSSETATTAVTSSSSSSSAATATAAAAAVSTKVTKAVTAVVADNNKVSFDCLLENAHSGSIQFDIEFIKLN
jgi:Ca2+-dependent lipid-binding protein